MTANMLKKCFAICLFIVAPSAGAAGVDTLAVAPFSVIGDSINTEIYEYGLPEAIANDLSHVPGLTIVERLRLSAVLREFSFSQAGFVGEQEAPRIGEMLGAKVVLVGTVQKSASNVRVYVRAVSVASGRVIFSVKAEQNIRAFSDIFKLEDVLAKKVVLQLGLSKADNEIKSIAKEPTFSEDAFHFYSSGFKCLDRGDYPKALNNFDKAADLDQNFEWVQMIRLRAQRAFDELDGESRKTKGEIPGKQQK